MSGNIVSRNICFTFPLEKLSAKILSLISCKNGSSEEEELALLGIILLD